LTNNSQGATASPSPLTSKWTIFYFLLGIDLLTHSILLTEPVAGDGNSDREQEIGSDIGQVYQIFPDEVLGSGQFGVVYGGEWLKWSLSCYLDSLLTFCCGRLRSTSQDK
jgi:protein kinase D